MKKIEINNMVFIFENYILEIKEFTTAEESRHVNLDKEEIEALQKFLEKVVK